MKLTINLTPVQEKGLTILNAQSNRTKSPPLEDFAASLISDWLDTQVAPIFKADAAPVKAQIAAEIDAVSADLSPQDHADLLAAVKTVTDKFTKI